MTTPHQPPDIPPAPASSTASAHPPAIRRATPADAHTVQQLMLELADHEGFGHAVHTTPRDWARLLAEDRVVVLLAHDGPRPIGYVSAVHQLHLWSGGDILAMDDLYTRAEARGTGVGAALMTALARHAAREGQLMVRWEMEHDNDAAQRFYRRLGAALRPKVIAAWQAHDYQHHIARADGTDGAGA